jgi:endonuclease YncB( thermonuclease family)
MSATRTFDFPLHSVTRVIDGDTAIFMVDQGFGSRFEARFRFLDIDTPEHSQAGHAECAAYVEQWLADRQGRVRVQTEKDPLASGAQSINRWLGRVYAVGPITGLPVEDLAKDLQELMDAHGWTSPGNH